MRSSPTRALLTIALTALIARGNGAIAHSAFAAEGASADRQATIANPPQAQTPASSVPAQSGSDQTLEIAPRIAPPPSAEAPTEPRDDVNLNDHSASPVDAQAAVPPTPLASSRPYLGIGVQSIYSDDRPGRVVAGLEIVSVDHNSPAALAGLRGRGKMTAVGESGATVGAMMPPLNLFVMPLLKKTGSLGEGGDLIVAIDDRRISNDLDLQSELASLKPGDTIYLTIVRATKDGPQQTLKVPIKLGDASKADDSGAAPPSASSAPRQP
jgi:PDZ domain-containing protein